MGLPDETLMLRFAGGDRSAFETLLVKYKPPLVEFAGCLVGDAATAEDIVQETFLRVFRSGKSYRPIAKFSTWIYRIATNLCYDELRKRKRRVSLETMLGRSATIRDRTLGPWPQPRPSERPPDVTAEQREIETLVDEVARTLSPEHQEVIRLRVREGLGCAETARRLGCSAGTVKSRLHYAIRNLREGLMKRM